MTENNGKSLGRGKRKVVERVEYKGEYRIVGTVWSGKNKVGYAVVDVKTFALRLFTAVQTAELLKRYKFENAELTGNEIKNTECAMDRLLKFDTNQNVIGNLGITILGKVYGDKDKVLGFRAMDATGKVVDISEKDIITIARRTPNGLLNAKQVPNPLGDPFVSAIKGSFKRIDKVSVEETVAIKDVSQEREAWMKQQHQIYLSRNLNKLFKELLEKGGLKPFKSKSKQLAVKRISKEFISVLFPELKQAKDSPAEDIVTAALLLYLSQNHDLVNRFGLSIRQFSAKYANAIVYREWGKDKVRFNIIDQNLLNIVRQKDDSGDAYKYLVLRNDIIEGRKYKVEEDTNPVTHLQISATLLSLRNDRYHRNKKLAEQKAGRDKDGFNPSNISYRSTNGIHELGYTIDRNLIGVDFDSIIYGRKPLRWIFEGLNLPVGDEEFLLSEINAFGDVEILRGIKKHLQEYNGDAQWLQGLLFTLAIHNPEIAYFAKERFFLTPVFDIDQISKENFFLNEEDILFYESGGKFNQNVDLARGESWSQWKLNEIPQATYEAISIHLANGSELPFPRKPWGNRR